jgi:HSP20 family protein
MHRELLNEMNRWLNANNGNDASSAATADWVPPVDIEEYTDRFVLYADVPGVETKDIEITLENGLLTLSGTRAAVVEPKDVQTRRTERATGRFYRRFNLPDTVEAESVSASGKNGTIEIVIPKRPASQPRKIEVHS